MPSTFGHEAVEHNAHPNIEYRFQDYREVGSSGCRGLGVKVKGLGFTCSPNPGK